MSLRARLALLVAFCVAAAVMAVSLVAYFVVEDRLVSAVDDTLGGRARFVAGQPPGSRPEGNDAPSPSAPDEMGRRWYTRLMRGGDDGGIIARRGPGIPSVDVFQVVSADGEIVVAPADQVVLLPVSDDDLGVALGNAKPFFHNATVDGDEYRVFSSPGPNNTVVLTARSLEEVNSTLADLRAILIVVSIAGIVVAAGLGLLVAHRSLRPVSKLTAAAEHVAATQDLSHSIEVRQGDEIGRLATSFNTMLQALETSRLQQRQLVTDANHELRTPLTSLRTNIELLTRDQSLPAEERQQILDDAMFEILELTKMVGELVDLATDPRSAEREREDIRLDEVAEAVVARARRRSGLIIELRSEPSLVVGHHDLIERAITNLVDNACKWTDDGGTIEVSVHGGTVSVRDQGPGIPASDLPHVFQRFYRSDEARSKPGSGLGLAIVKQIAEAHGGSVRAENAVDGGVSVTITLPATPMDPKPAAELAPRPSLAT